MGGFLRRENQQEGAEAKGAIHSIFQVFMQQIFKQSSVQALGLSERQKKISKMVKGKAFK